MNLTLSPSLQTEGAWAYEIKFLADAATAARAVAWARRRMIPDCHGEADLDGGYQTRTLYLDTPDFDVYRRTKGFRSAKLRIRRYGQANAVYVEQKRKRGDRVRKHRERLDACDLPALLDEATPSPWFRAEAAPRGFRPTCLVEYLRFAFNGLTPEGRVRLTVDGPIGAQRHEDWSLPSLHEPTPILTGQGIVEIKFADAMPNLFKELLESEPLTVTRVSKYRRGVASTEAPAAWRPLCLTS